MLHRAVNRATKGLRDAAGTMPGGNDQEAESLGGVFREGERHGGCMCETRCTAWLHKCNIDCTHGCVMSYLFIFRQSVLLSIPNATAVFPR